MDQIVYFDYNATTPVWPEVVQAMEPFWRDLAGNPSSLHQAGSQAARKIREARRDVRTFLGAQEASEIVFTSGGTESNNTAFRSALSTQHGKRRIVTTAVEHSSVLKLAKELAKEGVEVIFIPVDGEGNLDRVGLREALTPETALVSVMMANNETGVIFPVEEIAGEVRSKGILFHVDAVQAAGKIPISLRSVPIDFLSVSAHKFGGPKGVGALYVRKGTPFRPLILGGGQERGRRAGTENVPGILGMGAASRRVHLSFEEEAAKVRQLRDAFEKEILEKIPGVEVNGGQAPRLPNTSNIAFEEVDAEALLILLDEAGVCASSGSACLSGAPEPSHVLKAMGFSDERAKSSLRFSLGSENTFDEVRQAGKLIKEFVERLRQIELKEQHPHPVAG